MRGSAPAGAPPHRRILLNQAQQPQKYKGNYVATTKYNLLTFLPKALYEQFRRGGRQHHTNTARATKQQSRPKTGRGLLQAHCQPLLYAGGRHIMHLDQPHQVRRPPRRARRPPPAGGLHYRLRSALALGRQRRALVHAAPALCCLGPACAWCHGAGAAAAAVTASAAVRARRPARAPASRKADPPVRRAGRCADAGAAGPSGALRCARPRPGRPGWPLQRVRGAGPRRGARLRARARAQAHHHLPAAGHRAGRVHRQGGAGGRAAAPGRPRGQPAALPGLQPRRARLADAPLARRQGAPRACASALSAPAPASDRAVQPTMALALHGLGRLVTALGLQACLRIAKPSVVSGQCQGGGQKLAGCRAHGERQYASTRLVPGGSEQKGSEQLARIVTGWLAPWALPHAAGVSAPVAMGPAACCGACLHHRSASALLEAAGGRGRAGR